MSKESTEWLNNHVLMGFTSDREKWATNNYALKGDDVKPWFAEDGYSNGYENEVPIEAVETLFGWKAIEGPVFSYIPCDDMNTAMASGGYIDDGGQPWRKVLDETRKAILHSETGAFLNVRASTYGTHQYYDWLVENVAHIIDDEVQIGSAGELRGGGVAWVSVELPETIITERAGFPIRTRLLAFTSHDSTYKTSYKLSAESPLCDNSLDIEVRRDQREGVERKVSYKHTARSNLYVADAREALGMLFQQSEDMAAFVDELAAWDVTNKQFMGLMNQLHPMPEKQMDGGKVTNGRAITMAETRRGEITTMYLRDDRAAPWKGTALGVLQAFNTWDQQMRNVKGERVERKMLDTLGGDVAKFDAIVLNGLAELCDREAVAA